MSNESCPAKILEQYYMDLRSIYDSLFQIVKLFSASIIFCGSVLGIFFRNFDFSKGDDSSIIDTTVLIVYFSFIVISLFCSILILGQAYRYRITQYICKKIREDIGCGDYIPNNLYGDKITSNTNSENKQESNSTPTKMFHNAKNLKDIFLKIPTLFRYCYLFFITFIFFISIFVPLIIYSMHIFYYTIPTLFFSVSSLHIVSTYSYNKTVEVKNSFKKSS